MEDIKKELSSYKHDKRLLEEKEKEIDEYRNKATSCTSVLSDMPKGNAVHDKVAQYASIIADLEKEKYELCITLETNKRKIEQIINNLEQPYRNILYFRYIKDYNLTHIACDMN